MYGNSMAQWFHSPVYTHAEVYECMCYRRVRECSQQPRTDDNPSVHQQWSGQSVCCHKWTSVSPSDSRLMTHQRDTEAKRANTKKCLLQAQFSLALEVMVVSLFGKERQGSRGGQAGRDSEVLIRGCSVPRWSSWNTYSLCTFVFVG